jgi:hypothetical protein
MWCVLGTLGSFLKAASRSEGCLYLRLRLSPLALPCPRVDEEAATDWSAGMSLDPLSDREGFEEEHRRWCPRVRRGTEAAVALGAEETSDDARLPA